MLNFEEEMKAVKKGYVVLDIDEYNRMRDEIATANMKAYEAEQLANRRIAELLTVEKRTYGDHEIDIKFNKYAIHKLAVERLFELYSAEELEGYKLKTADNLFILDELIAYPEISQDTTAEE